MRQIGGGVACLLLVVLAGCGRTPAPSPAPVPTPLEVPAVERRWEDLTWTHTEIEPDPGGNVRLVAVAAGGDRIAVIGIDEGAALDSFFVTSPAGRDLRWERSGFGLEAELVDITATAGGFLAVGAGLPGANDEPRSGVFRSADGELWLPIADTSPFFDAYAMTVATGPRGFIATGASADGEPLIWLSGDGRTWSRTTTEELGLPRAMVESISAGPNGWLAAGRPRDGALAMSSADGSAWTASALVAGSRGMSPIATTAVDGGRARLILGMEVQECGFLWWEGDCAGAAAAWWSDARGQWAPLPLAGTPFPQWPVVAGTSDGFVAASGLAVHASPDGQRWALLTELDPAAGFLPDDIIVTDDRIVIVGSRTLPTGQQVGWIGVGAP